MNLFGLIVGLCTFLVIGLFHPLVIKGYYYLGMAARWVFLALGLVALAASLLIEDDLLSILTGVIAFSSFWSIKETYDQRKRVEKGWFPKNPKRKD